MLILCPAILLNLYNMTVFGDFRILYIEYHVICKFTSFFSMWMPFIMIFSCLIVLGRNSTIMLNKSDE